MPERSRFPWRESLPGQRAAGPLLRHADIAERCRSHPRDRGRTHFYRQTNDERGPRRCSCLQGGGVRVMQVFTDDRDTLQELLMELLSGADLENYIFSFGQEFGEFAHFNTDRQLAALQTAVKMLAVLNEKKSLTNFTTTVNANGLDI